MTNAYREQALRTAQICFSDWNRDPASPSYGCFDRPYWGWKKKDFPDAALQAAVTLCVRLAEDRGETAALPAWLDGYVEFLEAIQHRDGSFDQFYPNERAPGVAYDLLSAWLWLRRSAFLGTAARKKLETVIARAVAYALSADEAHGDIANHFAGFAWELLQAGRELALGEASRRGREYLDRTLALFNPGEGWFREYDGADAGYQTRLLAFLTRIAELMQDDALWDVCLQASRFVEWMLMPDDGLHPMLGVRSTALVYPSGFERLAARFPAAAPLADRIHNAWASGAVPLPAAIDAENGIRLAEDAFEAAALYEARHSTAPAPTRSSPEQAAFDFPGAGLHRRAWPGGVLHVGSSLGGVAIVHRRDAAGAWRLAHEDAGYLLRLGDGSRWLVRRAGAGQLVEQGDHRLVVEAGFARSLHEDLTPLRMILLRVLNLTVLRSQMIGDLFRKLVVRRLISGRHELGLRLRREVAVAGEGVTITDRLIAGPELAGRLRGARLYRCRRIVANHMASARYFSPDELAGGPWTVELPIDVVDGRPLVVRVGAAADDLQTDASVAR